MSIVDPPGFTQVSVLFVSAALSGAAAWYEVVLRSGADSGDWLALAVALEAAAVVGSAAVMGFEGVSPLLGATLGAAAAGQVRGLVGGAFEDSFAWAAWYGCFCAAGAVGMFFGGRVGRAIAGPVIGGLFAGSFACFMAATAFGGPSTWWDCMMAILSPTGVGSTGPVRVAGAICWACVATVGIASFFARGGHEDRAKRYPFWPILKMLGLPYKPEKVYRQDSGSNKGRNSGNLRQPLLDSGNIAQGLRNPYLIPKEPDTPQSSNTPRTNLSGTTNVTTLSKTTGSGYGSRGTGNMKPMVSAPAATSSASGFNVAKGLFKSVKNSVLSSGKPPPKAAPPRYGR